MEHHIDSGETAEEISYLFKGTTMHIIGAFIMYLDGIPYEQMTTL
jgi:hypothetical protein